MRKIGRIMACVAVIAVPPSLAHGATARSRLSAMARLGEKLFFDPALSASGRQSCASCHDPSHHFGPPDGRPVQSGGPDGTLPGIRAVPSLAYLYRTPRFTVGPESLQDKDAVVAVSGTVTADARTPAGSLTGHARRKAAGQPADVPQGGLFWDGRADTFEQQAMGPLLSPFEMANPGVDAIAGKLRKAAYAGDFFRLFGPRIFDEPDRAVAEAGFALARFQLEDQRFHPFSSKYDAYLRGKAKLTAAEVRGLRLFEDPAKGNCAACHLDRPDPDGRPPVFTDHEYEALGVPRNRAIPANRNPQFHDLGIGGPLRSDAYSTKIGNCGMFKTPTLRNVATRRVFFHNGIYHSLQQVLRFYAWRDVAPARIYPRRADGTVARFNDLPLKCRANIDRLDGPFGRRKGEHPALAASEINDIIAFLGTLTDR